MNEKWTWKPGVKVGPIRLNGLAEPIIRKYDLVRKEEYDAPGWMAFEFPENQAGISIEDSQIVSVSCYQEIYYKEHNLIGLSFDEIHEILGKEDEVGEVLIEETPVEYEELGLQLWFYESRVVTAIFYNPAAD